MRNPPEPPALPQREPFNPTQTPRTGTLIGPWSSPGPWPPRPPARPLEPGSELERHLAGLRLELASFREWWPEQLGRPRPGPAAVAAPAPPPLPGLGGRRRELERPLLVAGAAALLGLSVAFASASAALSWPAYGRLVARLGGAPAQAR